MYCVSFSFFFFSRVRAKSGSWSRAFLAEIAETGVKNREVPQRIASFCEVSLGKIGAKDVELFRYRSGHEFFLLQEIKALITLEQVNTSVKTSIDAEAINWSNVVNFHCMQMSIVMSMGLIFGYD